MVIRQTYTYAELEVSQTVWSEIHDLLVAAGYQHAIHKDSDGKIVIDMNGIGLVALPVKSTSASAHGGSDAVPPQEETNRP